MKYQLSKKTDVGFITMLSVNIAFVSKDCMLTMYCICESSLLLSYQCFLRSQEVCAS